MHVHTTISNQGGNFFFYSSCTAYYREMEISETEPAKIPRQSECKQLLGYREKIRLILLELYAEWIYYYSLLNFLVFNDDQDLDHTNSMFQIYS